MDGFTDVLLPTDRWPWSDVTGMMSLPLHSFLLPSLSWEWEGDWYVDQSCGGDPAETGVSRQHKRPDSTSHPSPRELGVLRVLQHPLLTAREFKMICHHRGTAPQH